MKTIWKYSIEEIKDQVSIEMPKGAEVLTVQMQHKTLCIWALVDPKAEIEKRYFEIFSTGHNIDMRIARRYIGTFPLYDGHLIFHLFEKVNIKI